MPHTHRSALSSALQSVVGRSAPRTLSYRVADRLQRIVEGRRLPHTDAATLVRLQGELRLVRDLPGVDPDGALAANLDLLEASASELGLEHFAVDWKRRETVRLAVVCPSLAVLVADLAARAPTTYVEFTDPAGRKRRELASQVDEADLEHAQTLRLYELVRPTPEVAPFGSRQGVVVERWYRDEDGALATTVKNPITTRVPDAAASHRTVEISTRSLPTFDVFDITTIEEITFPIDAVWLWVDGADPAWMQRRDEALRAAGRTPDLSATPARFREHGELRYSLRSVERFAPWIRHIYLVTDQQRPEWLVDHPRLTVVDHRDIFTDPDVLPTFNSHAIASQLHHIEGLADHYLVFNDDVLLARPVAPELFFDANGVAKFFLSKATVPAGPVAEDDLPHEAARKHARDLVSERYGHTPTRAFQHTPIPQVRALQELLESRYPDEFTRTAASPFRSVRDVETVSWLHHYAGYFERWTRPAAIRYDYFHIGQRDALARMERRLRSGGVDCLCVNDADDGDVDDEERFQRLRAFLEALVPDPSSFERPDAS